METGKLYMTVLGWILPDLIGVRFKVLLNSEYYLIFKVFSSKYKLFMEHSVQRLVVRLQRHARLLV